MAEKSHAAPYGEVFDRGYAHYDGPRLGRKHAMRALIGYSIKRSLGIKKSWTAKILPILLYVAVSLPVIISIGIRAFLPTAEILDYSDFFPFIYAIEGMFVATIAPEMLCGDRRENVLPLYFSRSLSRFDYLVGKIAATTLLTMTVSCVPATVLWLGRQFLSDAPLAAMRDNAGELGKILVIGLMIALYLGSGGLLISSFTGRKGIAVAIIVVLFLVVELLLHALVAALDTSWEDKLFLLSPTNTTGTLVNRLLNEATTVNLSLWEALGAMWVVIIGSLVVMAWRYIPRD